MGRLAIGAKVGALAGLIYARVESAVVAGLLLLFKDNVIAEISKGLPPGTVIKVETLYKVLVEGDVIIAALFGILAGIILGLVFAAVSDHIPGRRGFIKGVFFGLVLWVILHVIADYFGNLRYGLSFYVTDIGLGLITTLLYGTLLGMLFERRIADSGTST